MSLCDDSSVTLQCDGDDSLRLMVRWSAALYDLPTSDLPDLHDVGEQTIDCIQKMAITTVTHLFLDFHMISLVFFSAEVKLIFFSTLTFTISSQSGDSWEELKQLVSNRGRCKAALVEPKNKSM